MPSRRLVYGLSLAISLHIPSLLSSNDIAPSNWSAPWGWPRLTASSMAQRLAFNYLLVWTRLWSISVSANVALAPAVRLVLRGGATRFTISGGHLDGAWLRRVEIQRLKLLHTFPTITSKLCMGRCKGSRCYIDKIAQEE